MPGRPASVVARPPWAPRAGQAQATHSKRIVKWRIFRFASLSRWVSSLRFRRQASLLGSPMLLLLGPLSGLSPCRATRSSATTTIMIALFLCQHASKVISRLLYSHGRRIISSGPANHRPPPIVRPLRPSRARH